MYDISYSDLVDIGHVISNEMTDSRMLASLKGSQVLIKADISKKESILQIAMQDVKTLKLVNYL